MGAARKLSPEELSGVADAPAPPAAPPPDRVAPYGLSGVVSGRTGGASPRKLTPEELSGAALAEDRSLAESAVRGAVKGASLGASGFLSAVIDTAASRVPGWLGGKYIASAAQSLQPADMPPITDPNVTFDQRRAAYSKSIGAAQAANPKAFLAGELAGGIATPVPGVGAAGGAVSGIVGKAINATAGKIAAGAVKGAISGAAYGAGSGLSEGHSAAQLGTDALHGGAGGAVIGGALSTVGAAAGAYAKGAAGRLKGRLTDDVLHGDTNVGKRTGDKVLARAGEDNDRIASVLDELPAVKKEVALHAKGNPARVAAAAQRSVDHLTEQNDAVYEAIQAQHGGVSLGDLVTSVTRQVVKSRNTGKAIAEDAAEAIRKDLLKRFGYEGKWTPDMKLSAEQIRNYRNDLGDVAFAGSSPSVTATKKRAAFADVYSAFNEGIEKVAAKTDGVNLDAFKARNRQVSTMIPVIDALSERAAKEAGSGKAKAILGKIAAAALPAGGAFAQFGGGSLEGLALGGAAYLGARAAGKAARVLDYNIATKSYEAPMAKAVERLKAAAATNPRAAALVNAIVKRGSRNASTALAAPLGAVTSSTLGASP